MATARATKLGKVQELTARNRSCLKEEVLGECLGSKGAVRAAVLRPQVQGRGQEVSGGAPVSSMCLRTSTLLRSPQCVDILGRRV